MAVIPTFPQFCLPHLMSLLVLFVVMTNGLLPHSPNHPGMSQLIREG